MVAENTRIFQTYGAAEWVMASPDRSEHNRLSRGVHNCDCDIRDRVLEDTVLAGGGVVRVGQLAFIQNIHCRQKAHCFSEDKKKKKKEQHQGFRRGPPP